MNSIKRKIRLLTIFCGNFFAASMAVSALLTLLLYTYGGSLFFSSFLCKVFTNAALCYFVSRRSNREFIFYKNLGLSPKELWATTMSIDMILFILLSVLTITTGMTS